MTMILTATIKHSKHTHAFWCKAERSPHYNDEKTTLLSFVNSTFSKHVQIQLQHRNLFWPSFCDSLFDNATLSKLWMHIAHNPLQIVFLCPCLSRQTNFFLLPVLLIKEFIVDSSQWFYKFNNEHVSVQTYLTKVTKPQHAQLHALLH